MNRRQFLGTAASAPAILAQGSRPNLLFITADDLGLQLSCYGEKLISTPNMDKLAASGVQFSTAYVVQASCSPSRSGMFTGVYPHANGQYGLVNGGFSLHEQYREATIPNVLKPAGYRTGIIGKLHVAPEPSFAFDTAHKNSAATRKVRDVAQLAGEFLQAGSRDPFFLMVNFSDPHAFRDGPQADWYFPPQVDGLPARPLQPSASTLFPFQGVEGDYHRERTANYYNAIQRLDTGVGMLMDALEKSGKAGNTVVVFCGDHGPPFARGKTTCYESGLRVPFLVRWPGVSVPGISPAMASTVDIAPTLFDAAGVTSPVQMHGRSLRSVLASRTAPWRRYLAGEFHFHGAKPFYPRRAVRDSRYKLIHNLRAGAAKPSTTIDGDRAFETSRASQYANTPLRRAFDTFSNPPQYELYDLSTDPHELDNISAKPEMAKVRQQMIGALNRWRKETADPFLDPAMIRKYASYEPPPA